MSSVLLLMRCRLLVPALNILVLLSCRESAAPNDRTVSRIEVSPDRFDLQVGDARQLSASARDATGGALARSLFWSTSNPAVVTVTQSGVVTSVAPGSARIAASAGGTSVIVPVTVAPPPASLVRVTPTLVDHRGEWHGHVERRGA